MEKQKITVEISKDITQFRIRADNKALKKIISNLIMPSAYEGHISKEPESTFPIADGVIQKEPIISIYCPEAVSADVLKGLKDDYEVEIKIK